MRLPFFQRPVRILAGVCFAASLMAAADPAEVMLPGSGKIAVDEHPRREMLWWATPVPNAVGDEDEDKPYMDVYLPPSERASGTAVVICPGGGYGAMQMDREGQEIARWLNSQGIAGFVLHYRVAPRYLYPAQLIDAQRAVRLVRGKAKMYHLATDRIGILGFSAGGYVASTAGTKFDDGDHFSADPIDTMSSRPDFMILTYPVISLNPAMTQEPKSKKGILGLNSDPKILGTLSTDTQVTSRTPPTFLFHANEDTGVPADNSVVFYMALRSHGVPAELHIYEQTARGGGTSSDEVLSVWPERLAEWLRGRELTLTPARLASTGAVNSTR